MIGGLLSKVPFRAREVTELCVPMFHALGFALMAMGLALGSTLVVRRHFDPEKTLDSLEENEVTALIVVPVMLQRMLELGADKITDHDLSALKIIFIGGSQLGGEVAKRGLKAFGPVLYNLYGSTEVAYATIAKPEELEKEPTTVGGVVRGTIVKILNDDGDEVQPGETGRIFVANAAQFEGYTGGETKEQIKGMMSSGDVGHFDENGWLFIDGRDDEMIVSGGENVFPGEVEELLAGHDAVEEAAVIGVDDEKFGQRLKAFVVVRDGQDLSEDDVKGYVKENLARYKVPREVDFLDELPRNSTGKVVKRELKEQGEDAGDAETSDDAATADDAAAADDAETADDAAAADEDSGDGQPSGKQATAAAAAEDE
jgi:fatty-acyl-CoA synthase